MLSLAIYRKDKNIIDYSIFLASLGFLVAAYHNYIYYFNVSLGPCAAAGVSCVQQFISEIGGYISIPMMSMTGFLVIIVTLLIAKDYKK